MLEPLMMGELSYTELESELDIKLFKCILQNLDTVQISKKLISKLIKRKMYFSAWYLLQNNPHFSVSDKHECLIHLAKHKDLFDIIFGINKDIINDKNDLSDAIAKFENIVGFKLEKALLDLLYYKFAENLEYDYALK
jgi:hypothetical protein